MELVAEAPEHALAISGIIVPQQCRMDIFDGGVVYGAAKHDVIVRRG